MILKSLRLKNIRSYSEEVLNFPTGSILLAGDIGAGKSSILHAVEFALFGTRRDLSGDALLRKGEHQGEAELTFLLGEKEISIKRTLKKTKDGVAQGTGYIIIDGVRQDLTTTELKAKMLALLGYPAELLTRSKALIYRYTVYTPQEEMKQILFDNADNRIDTLRKVFGIDKYKKIIENAQIYTKRLRDERRRLEGSVEDLPMKEKALAVRREETERLRQELSKRTARLMITQEKRAEQQKETEKKEQMLKELLELKKKNELLDAKLKEIIRQRARNIDEISITAEKIKRTESAMEEMAFAERQYPEVDSVEKALEEKEKALRDVEAKKTRLLETKRHLIQKIEETERRIEEKNKGAYLLEEKKKMISEFLETLKEKDLLREGIEDSEKAVKELEQKLTELRTKKEASQSLKEKILALDRCPTCMQTVTAEHKEKISTAENEKIRQYSVQLEALRRKRDEFIQRLEEYRKKNDELIETERKIAQIKTELTNLEEVNREIEKLKKITDLLNKEKIGLFRALEETDDAVIDQLRNEVEENKRLLHDIHKYKIQLQKYLSYKQLIEEKEARLRALTLTNNELKERVKDINLEKIKISEDLERMKTAENEYRIAKEELDEKLKEERQAEIAVEGKKKELEGMERLVEVLRTDVEEKKKNLQRIRSISSINEWLDKLFINLMNTMERHVMIKIHQQFNELFSQWFGLLIDDDTLNVRLDDSFCPVVVQNGYETYVEHLSGGEKTAIALAYRLALNKVVNDIVDTIKTKDLIILDEPTDGFSSEQLDKVREVLEQLNMKQIIIVSHEQKIESFVNNVIRVNKNDHLSRIVV